MFRIKTILIVGVLNLTISYVQLLFLALIYVTVKSVSDPFLSL